MWNHSRAELLPPCITFPLPHPSSYRLYPNRIPYHQVSKITSCNRTRVKRKFHESNDAGSARTQLQSLQENDVFRAILFICGVLPQTLKLYACTGIPGCQILVSLYLVPWIVLELMVLLPARYSEHKTLAGANSEQQGFIALTDRIAALACYRTVQFSDIMALCVVIADLHQLQHLRSPPLAAPVRFASIGLDGILGLLFLSSHLQPPDDMAGKF